jgi:hypothetical protein
LFNLLVIFALDFSMDAIKANPGVFLELARIGCCPACVARYAHIRDDLFLLSNADLVKRFEEMDLGFQFSAGSL